MYLSGRWPCCCSGDNLSRVIHFNRYLYESFAKYSELSVYSNSQYNVIPPSCWQSFLWRQKLKLNSTRGISQISWIWICHGVFRAISYNLVFYVGHLYVTVKLEQEQDSLTRISRDVYDDPVLDMLMRPLQYYEVELLTRDIKLVNQVFWQWSRKRLEAVVHAI
jgi:hypothetical protein